MKSFPVALAGLLLAGAAHAQAPRITPAGDPSVRSDTIYRLAVDPVAHRGESAIVLLDDGVLRYEADGTGAATYRQVAQVLDGEAVREYSEHAFEYEPAHQTLTINWIRVVKPSGEVVAAGPALLRESDLAEETSDALLNDRKVVRASLSGVQPGVLVDYSYTLEEKKPYRPGDFSEWWGPGAGVGTKRARLIVDVPSSLEPRIVEENLTIPRRTTRAGGRTVYEWAAADLPSIEEEALAPDSSGVHMVVGVASPSSWADIAGWYASLARDRYAITPAVDRKLREVVRGARTREEKIRAVHRWVAQDVDYLSAGVGIGDYQPRSPEEVLRTGFGDCKDKATLFVAALRQLGITAYPVLLSSTGGVERALPTIDQLDHVIAAVANPGGGYTFTDLTADLVPYGTLPDDEQGEFALVVHPDGSGEERTMPRDPITANESITRLAGEILADGTFRGSYEVVGRGAHQQELRELFAEPLDRERRAAVTRSLAREALGGATGDSLVAFDGKDLTAEARFSLRISGGKAATRSGSALVLTNRLGGMESVLERIAELEGASARRFPIDAEKVLGGQASVVELRVVVPEGMVAALPRSVTVKSAFGSYSAEYSQEGRELSIVRRISGARGVFGPEKLPELLAWYRAVARDQAAFISLAPEGETD